MKNKLSIILAVLTLILSGGCSKGNGTSIPPINDSQTSIIESNESESIIQSTLPDYDSIDADDFLFNSWYAPALTYEAFKEYKDCGFTHIFLIGKTVEPIGGEAMKKALEFCDQLGIKAYIDITEREDEILSFAKLYTSYESFVGFNYDEPAVHTEELIGRRGIIEISPFVELFHENYPDHEFLLNLRSTSCVNNKWEHPFTYQEYVDAEVNYINSIYYDTEVTNWISADDYPLYYNKKQDTLYLKETWPLNLEYLAEAKSASNGKLTSNFFIQSMPFGKGNKSRNRVPSYEDLRLQLYMLLTYGYDCASFFCYGTPPATDDGEFTEEQVALIDRQGNKTQLYHDSKKVIAEINSLANTYMQFNDNWRGVLPVVGTNNLKSNPEYKNPAFENLQRALSSVKRLKGVSSITATEDAFVGYMQDNKGNPGYTVVNYNDTSEKKTCDVVLTFNSYNKAIVYIGGEKQIVDLTNNTLTLNLGIGEGVFFIPYEG